MDDDSDETLGVGWRDVLTNLVGFMAAWVILFAALMSVEQAKTEDAAEPPGTMEMKMQYTNGPIDVDLWVYSTGEELPVGFSRTSGKVWSLVRDDLGTSNDDPDFPANIENMYARTAKPGHYIANVVCYTCHTFPVKVNLEIRIANMGGTAGSRVLLSTTVELTKPRQEVTVVQFDLNKNGAIVNGSVSNVFKPLWQAWQS